MTAKPIAVMSIASVLLTACGAPTPQAAFNSRSDYAAEGLDLFQVIIVLGVVSVRRVATDAKAEQDIPTPTSDPVIGIALSAAEVAEIRTLALGRAHRRGRCG